MSARHPLHVVQLSRDTGLLELSADAEPVERQLEYARELDRRVPGALVTIIVVGRHGGAVSWQRENLRVVPLLVGSSLRAGLDCLRALHTLHEITPISVITTQTPNDEGWLALAVGRWHRIPVIGQIHSELFAESADSLAAEGFAQALRRWLTRRTLRGFAAVRTVSSESRTSIARLAATVPLATIPVPVPMVCSHTRVRAFPHREPLVIFVGRLAPEKDLSAWLRVAHAVSHLHPEARFKVIGDGQERSRLEDEAVALGLGGVLSFEGFVPNSRLRDVYATAAVLLLTSRAEGFGRVLVEAASQGTPAVSTSLSGPREVVINGVTGFLHEPGDVDGLARSVSTLVSHPHRAAAMGARARAFVTVKFDPERLRAAWVDLWIRTARAGGCAG